MKCKACQKEIVFGKTSNTFKNNIYCAKHYQQILKHGHCLDNIQRTTKDLNDFEYLDKDTIKIFTYNQRNERYGFFIIDASDLDIVICNKWRIWKNRVFTGNFKPITISRFLLQDSISEDDVVDHINSNPYDNRRCNLRIVKQQQNTINKTLQSNNKSHFAGIYYDSNRMKWVVEIRYKQIKYFLGRYDLIEDAIYARYIAERALFKSFRSTKNDKIILKKIFTCKNKKTISKYIKTRIYSTYNIFK